MTRYLLDTNIISNVVKTEPSQSLLAWLGAQRDDRLFIAALTVAEIWRGVLTMPPGRKRQGLEAWFFGPDGPSALLPAASCPLTLRRPWSGRGLWPRATPKAVPAAPST